MIIITVNLTYLSAYLRMHLYTPIATCKHCAIFSPFLFDFFLSMKNSIKCFGQYAIPLPFHDDISFLSHIFNVI